MIDSKCEDCQHENPTEFDCFDCPPPHVRQKEKQVPSALNNLLDAESLARRFHEKYELLAPYYNYETRKASRVDWQDVPDNNKKLMIAVCGELISEGI